MSAQRIATLGVLSALGVVGRLVFGLPFLPNIQPMTVIILLVAHEFKLLESIIMGTTVVLVTSIYMGMGPWVVGQVVAYWILMVVSRTISKLGFKNGKYILMLWSVIFGFVYGIILMYFDHLIYGIPNFTVYYLNGLPFDFLHGFGNLGFFIILYPLMDRLGIQKMSKNNEN